MRRIISEFKLYLCNEWIAAFPSHHIRLWFYRTLMGFKIGNKSSVFMHCSFDSGKGLKIGNYSTINSKCRFDTRGGIEIGDSVSISQDVIILTADHDVDALDFAGRDRAVVIENYVWIGTRAVILPGVTIGKGALIAAGAVVTKNVSPFSVVAGIPAKEIRRRPTDIEYTTYYRRLFQ